MNFAREDHTSTLLQNGQVLVAGGFNRGVVIASAELYNPTTRTWTVTGNMTIPRFQHTATLLPNGNVLVTGGNDNGYLSSAELYNPATGVWTTTASMSTAREDHTADVIARMGWS